MISKKRGKRRSSMIDLRRIKYESMYGFMARTSFASSLSFRNMCYEESETIPSGKGRYIASDTLTATHDPDYIKRVMHGMGIPAASEFRKDLEPLLGPFRINLDTNAQYLTSDNLKFCPFCIRKGEHNMIQQLPFQDKCHIHGCRLIEVCPTCGEPIPYFLYPGAGKGIICPNCGKQLIDEYKSGSNLVAQYKQLKYLYNKLREADVVLITFLVGTDAMLSTKEIFEKSGSEGEQITRRFMQGLYEFHSVSDLDQLKYVLDSYDTMKFGGLTYTQYYFPEAWKKGVRLSDIAEEMLDVMLEISGLTVLPEVPMGYLTTLINAIYLTYGADTEKVDGNGKSLKREWPSRSEIRDMMYKQNIEKKLIDLAAKNVVTREGRMYA